MPKTCGHCNFLMIGIEDPVYYCGAHAANGYSRRLEVTDDIEPLQIGGGECGEDDDGDDEE